MTPEELRNLADELMSLAPWARGTIMAAADEIEQLHKDLDHSDMLRLHQTSELRSEVESLNTLHRKRLLELRVEIAALKQVSARQTQVLEIDDVDCRRCGGLGYAEIRQNQCSICSGTGKAK